MSKPRTTERHCEQMMELLGDEDSVRAETTADALAYHKLLRALREMPQHRVDRAQRDGGYFMVAVSDIEFVIEQGPSAETSERKLAALIEGLEGEITEAIGFYDSESVAIENIETLIAAAKEPA